MGHPALRLSLVALLSLTALVAASETASAQQGTGRQAARAHFRRGVQHFEAGEMTQALAEFEAAYDAAPNYQVLFNIGSVHAAQGEAVEAADAYERYLAEGGTRIDRSLRAQAEQALEAQRARIGLVTVTTNVDGAMVVVDSVDAERTTPMTTPLRLSVGRYAIGVRLSGYDEPTREVTVAGSTEQTVALELVPNADARGNISVTSNVREVEVMIDGTAVGMTPLAEQMVVEPGMHEVAGARAGYVPFRQEVLVADGGAITVTLAMEVDPSARPEHRGVLALTLPDADTMLRIDGEEVALEGGRAGLPIGNHELSLVVEGRKEVTETIEVRSGNVLTLAPDLEWTDSARRTQIDRSSTFRTLGWILGSTGVAAAGISVGLFVWNQGRINQLADYEAQLNGPGGCYNEGRDCDAEYGDGTTAEYESLDNSSEAIGLTTTATIIGMVGGAALAALGITFILLADSEEEIDAAASASLRIGPGHVTLLGTF